ncbi:MAG TPA: hypothetical protein VFV73_34635 [Streptosporangiaceae bacterium]|nr:hypothetical protein [Streptosporangiaceae bacterium]
MRINAAGLDASPVTVAEAQAEFGAGLTYLDTAAFGLPPRRSWVAPQQALAQWRAGTADAVAYDVPVAAARSAYAQLAGVDPSAVAVGSQVPVFAGLIAANLHGGSEVLTATGDFTSILFPFYAQSSRGIRIQEAPLERIADAVTSRTTLVAVSAVQSADGRVADLDALHSASSATGAWGAAGHDPGRRVAAGRREPLRLHRPRRVQVAALPRGTAYFTISPARCAWPATPAASTSLQLISGATPRAALAPSPVPAPGESTPNADFRGG